MVETARAFIYLPSAVQPTIRLFFNPWCLVRIHRLNHVRVKRLEHPRESLAHLRIISET